VFKGETLRSMLLNAYGWWKVSQITYIAALVSFGLGTAAAFVAGFAFVTGRRTKAVSKCCRAPDLTPRSRSHESPTTASGRRAHRAGWTSLTN
jgi:hypothetical protein